MGVIIENSKKSFTYSFNLDNVKQFINTCTDLISNDLKMRLK